MAMPQQQQQQQQQQQLQLLQYQAMLQQSHLGLPSHQLRDNAVLYCAPPAAGDAVGLQSLASAMQLAPHNEETQFSSSTDDGRVRHPASSSASASPALNGQAVHHV